MIFEGGSRSWVSSLNFAEIHPPHSCNYKSPSTFGREGRTALLCSCSWLLWHCPIPRLKRGMWTSLPKAKNGNATSISIQGSHCSSVTWRFPPSLPCNDTCNDTWLLKHVGEYSVKCLIHCGDLEGCEECWACISVF